MKKLQYEKKTHIPSELFKFFGAKEIWCLRGLRNKVKRTECITTDATYITIIGV